MCRQLEGLVSIALVEVQVFSSAPDMMPRGA